MPSTLPENVFQRVIEYETSTQKASCGVTVFQCGTSPVIILTDLDNEGLSVTNGIEFVATKIFKDYLTMTNPDKIIVIEHYPQTRNRQENSFYRVNMKWDVKKEAFYNPKWIKTLEEGVFNLLGCFGYQYIKKTDISFNKAKIIQF